MGEEAGYSGRPRPRLRRRLAGRLFAHHHRSRPDPLRAPVRALPQSRSRVDAGLRHRLLPGPPRRGDPLRAKRYGRDQVAQIITFGTLQARGVLRDVGRVLQMPYGQVDKLCKLVPQNPAHPISLAKASRTSRSCRPSATATRWSSAPSTSPRSWRASTATPPPTPPASSSATGRCPSWCRSTATRNPTCRSPSSA